LTVTPVGAAGTIVTFIGIDLAETSEEDTAAIAKT
jgi:hypothetical protein